MINQSIILKMKKLLFALACLTSFHSVAHAALVRYAYTGVVYIAGTDSPTAYVSGVAALDDGYSVFEGNTVTGTITYDTDTALWVSTGRNVDYYKGIGASTLDVIENGFHFASTSADNPQLQVADNTDMYDGSVDLFGFSSHTYRRGAEPRYVLGFGVFDFTGTAFQSKALPPLLELDRFQQRDVTFYYYGDDVKSQFSAEINSLKLVSEVPEPATPALVFAGIALLVGLRRFKAGSRSLVST